MTNQVEETVEVSGFTPEEESIHWTRQVDGSYAKEGNLPANTPAVRIFEIDEDYKTNPYAVCAGQKLWPQEEAVALVEGKIAEGSYQAWRYEIRPELSSAGPPPVPAMAPSESPARRLCSNPRCKKGPNGTRGIVKSRRAKYCCRYCRVDVSRRGRPKPEQIEKPKRKRRSDAKYASHAERQRACQARHSTSHLPRGIRDLLWMRARMVDKRVQEPVAAINFPDRRLFHAEQVLSPLSVRVCCVSTERYVLDDQVPLFPR
jgi:hypothetical protein